MPKSSDSQSVSTLTYDPKDKDLVCGACLMELFDGESEFLGCPSGCPHIFHWDCLARWGELQNSCPQCKHRFRVAAKYRQQDRELIECIKFKKRNRVDQGSDPSDLSDLPIDLCEKCKEPGNDEDLILCDGMDFTCNALYHFRCVGFQSVPSGLWFCENCTSKGYVPDEFKKSKKQKIVRTEISEDNERSKRPRSRSPPPPPIRIVPQLFPRQLLVNHSANTRAQSSGIPTKLILDAGSLVPNLVQPVNRPINSDQTVSIFARFRQRRMEKKQAGNSTVNR
jgi:hypothetical protein